MADIKIKNIEGLSIDDINRELENGAKFVMFQYCISVIIMTFRRSSSIYFVKAHEMPIKYGISHTLTTLLFGWWGIPWGPLYSIGALYNNLKGGKNVTQEVINSINGIKSAD